MHVRSLTVSLARTTEGQSPLPDSAFYALAPLINAFELEHPLIAIALKQASLVGALGEGLAMVTS